MRRVPGICRTRVRRIIAAFRDAPLIGGRELARGLVQSASRFGNHGAAGNAHVTISCENGVATIVSPTTFGLKATAGDNNVVFCINAAAIRTRITAFGCDIGGAGDGHAATVRKDAGAILLRRAAVYDDFSTACDGHVAI